MKRVHQLIPGEVFLMYNTKYMVTHFENDFIFYRHLSNGHCIGRLSFGNKSMQWVQMINDAA